MTKSLWIGLAILIPIFDITGAQSLTEKGEGVFVGEEATGKIAMKSGQQIIINAANTLGGGLSLEAGANDCHFAYVKVLKTPTRVEAIEFAKAISVEIEKEKNVVILSLRAPAQAPWAGTNNSGRLKVRVFIPDNCAVEFNTAYFDIAATGPFKEFVVTESLSKVQVEKVFGLVDVKVSNRPLIIKDVTGKLVATNKYDRLRLENIDTGENLGTVRNEHGEISIENYQGGLDARTSYGNIIGQNLSLIGAKNRVKNVSALISLSFDSLTTGKLRVNNKYEHINLEVAHRVDAQFICRSGEEGSITADHMDIVPTLVDENRLDLETGEATAEVRLTTRGSGDITIIGPDKTNIAGGK